MIVPILLALVVGGAVARLRGRRFASIGSVQFRRTFVLVPAMVLTVTPATLTLGRGVDLALTAGAFGLVGWFLASNLRGRSGALRLGLAVLALGWASNVLVISINGAMPLSLAAYEASGQLGVPGTGRGGFYRVSLADRETRLRFLGDVVPIPLLRNVFSPGDLILAVGVGVSISGAMAQSQRRQNSLPSGSAIVTR